MPTDAQRSDLAQPPLTRMPRPLRLARLTAARTRQRVSHLLRSDTVGGVLARLGAAWFARRRWAAWAVLLPVGMSAWGFVHASGVHATIAGVLLAAVVPVTVRVAGRGGGKATAGSAVAAHPIRLTEIFEHRFSPLSAGFAVPVFAFFAFGVAVGGLGEGAVWFEQRISIGIAIGLVLGKPLGIVLSTVLLTRTTRAGFAESVTFRDLLGVGCLAGGGFTVAMLLAELSFVSSVEAGIAKLAVMVASLIAVVVAALVLVPSSRRRVARQ
ncbi:MAG: hypothetical protein GX814_02460 [Microbacteriaceae bacterium]|nr:hypothetical protein [Microbacteriaceae bacterium]